MHTLIRCLERQARKAAVRIQALWRARAVRQRLAALLAASVTIQARMRGHQQRSRFLRVRICPCAARAGQHRSAGQLMLVCCCHAIGTKFLRPLVDCLVTCS